MSLKKLSNITPAELKSKGVVSLADKPNAAASYGVGGLSPTALKLWFDQLSKLLAGKINAIQDALSGDQAAEYIKLILTGLDAGNESGVYSLKDLCDAFKDGKFAEYLQLYGSAAAENLSSLQTIINSYGLSIFNATNAASEAKNNSIKSIEITYQEGKSGTVCPTEEKWTPEIPVVQKGNFLWTRIRIILFNQLRTDYYSVSKIGKDGDDLYGFTLENGDLILIKADSAEDNINYEIDSDGNLSVAITY